MRAFVFPGQGIQKRGMGKELYEHFPVAREFFDLTDSISARPLSRLMFDGSEVELARPTNAQPAIFVYEVALALSQQDVTPDVVAGHSFGEFAALVVSGCLAFEDALRLVLRRAELGEQSKRLNPDVAMAAIVGLPEDTVRTVINQLGDSERNLIFIANYNGPGQVVLSGQASVVKACCAELKRAGAKRAVVLPIEGAFHTPLVARLEAELARDIERTAFRTPRIPVCQCASTQISSDPDELRHNLFSHATSSVDWTTMVNRLVGYGVSQFYEAGTDDTLQKIVRRMHPHLVTTSLLHCPTYIGKIPDYSV